MGGGDLVAVGEVGYGAGYAEDAVVGSGGEAQSVHGGFHSPISLRASYGSQENQP